MASGGSRPSESDKGKGKRLMITEPPPPPPPPPPAQSTFAAPDLFAVHFEKVFDPDTEKFEATCNYCGRFYEFNEDEGCNQLINHLNKKHPEEIGNELRELDVDSSEGSTGTDPTMIYRFSHNRVKTTTAKFVCVASLRFNFADTDHYEKFVKACNPMAKRIPRQELIDEIIRLVKESKVVLINDFANLSNKVSICLDFWSDQLDRWHYIGITCHWIDDSWTLQKRLIAFKCFSAAGTARTATNISRVTWKLLQNFGLDKKKVFSISFDNDTANSVGLESLVNVCQPSLGANFSHVRSISCVLSLFAQDALTALEEEIAPIRKAAIKLCDDTSLAVKWAKFCKKKGLVPTLFLVDLESGRWDSAYKMLNVSYEYRHALCLFFSKEKCGVDLSPNQWDACFNLTRLLKTFKDAVEQLSGVYNPSSVLVVDNFVKVAVVFNSLIECDKLRECSGGMISKWLEHFREIPNVFLLAKVFDPRVRMNGLEKMLEIYYDALFPIKDDRTPLPTLVVANVKTCLYELFQEYRMRFSDSLGIDSSASGSGDQISLSVRLQNLFNEMSQKRPRSQGCCNPYAEIESYLIADFEYIDTEFDVLKWWSRRETQFPVMSLIARDILAVPANTVSAEQAFSTEEGGYTLDERQTKLSFRNLENQLLLGDWTKAETRDQENDYEEEGEGDPIFDFETGEIV